MFHYSMWEIITKDKFILDVVKHGLRLDFTDFKPQYEGNPRTKFSDKEISVITAEIGKLLKKKVVKASDKVLFPAYLPDLKKITHSE